MIYDFISYIFKQMYLKHFCKQNIGYFEQAQQGPDIFYYHDIRRFWTAAR